MRYAVKVRFWDRKASFYRNQVSYVFFEEYANSGVCKQQCYTVFGVELKSRVGTLTWSPSQASFRLSTTVPRAESPARDCLVWSLLLYHWALSTTGCKKFVNILYLHLLLPRAGEKIMSHNGVEQKIGERDTEHTQLHSFVMHETAIPLISLKLLVSVEKRCFEEKLRCILCARMHGICIKENVVVPCGRKCL